MPLSGEILVVGGGPAGASTAFALARQGRDVLVLDRAHFPRPKPCAEYLSPEASRILADMGALTRVEQSGAAALSGIMVRSPDGHEIRGEFVADHGYSGFRDRGLSVRREVLDDILLDCARRAGARVEEGVRVVDLNRDVNGRICGVVATFGANTTRHTIHARLVVGADGLRSTVARRLGVARHSRWPKRLALVSHFRGVDGLTDLAEMHVERDGFVGIADVGHGIATVALVVPARRAREISHDRETFLTQWLDDRPQLSPRFSKATRVSPVVATGPFASYASRAWAPGALLVGDAAEFFDPFTGEGIFTARRGGELASAAAAAYLDASTPNASDHTLATMRSHAARSFWRQVDGRAGNRCGGGNTPPDQSRREIALHATGPRGSACGSHRRFRSRA